MKNHTLEKFPLDEKAKEALAKARNSLPSRGPFLSALSNEVNETVNYIQKNYKQVTKLIKSR